MRVTEDRPIRAGLLSLLLLAAALGGCAVTAPPPDPVPALAPDTPAGVPQWWVVRVRMGWEDRAQVDWHLDALLAEQVNAQVDALWQTHAQHAWLHHLNALFGYRPILLQERRLMRI